MRHGSRAAAGGAAWLHAFTNGGHASAEKEMSFSITFPLLVRWLQVLPPLLWRTSIPAL
jgi:hypothetical protein